MTDENVLSGGLSPVRAADRIESLDVPKGFALLGKSSLGWLKGREPALQAHLLVVCHRHYPCIFSLERRYPGSLMQHPKRRLKLDH